MSDKRTVIPPSEFLKMIPSSAAKLKPSAPPLVPHTVSVQRKNRANRWIEMARFEIWTDETDMKGPLNCGLQDNYRIIIRERTDNSVDLTEEEKDT